MHLDVFTTLAIYAGHFVEMQDFRLVPAVMLLIYSDQNLRTFT